MRAAFVKTPFRFEIRDLPPRPLGDDELLVDVRACGLGGADLAVARSAADWTPIGREAAGVVSAVGARAGAVGVGRKVVVSGTRAGLADAVIVDRGAALPFDGISFTAAALAVPLGLALDLVERAGIRIGDAVLVVGAGAVGLMAVRLARLRGAGRVAVAQRAGARRRVELAREMGADDVVPVSDGRIEGGGGPADRVLVAAEPGALPAAVSAAADDGIVVIVGPACDEAPVAFDVGAFAGRRLELRVARAPAPATLATALGLLRAGTVNGERLVSHTFELDEAPQASRIMRDDRQNRVKLVMVKD